jgi:putative membrane protein
MRGNLLTSFILTSFSFCLLGGSAALAQAPGGQAPGGQSPSMPQSSPTRPGAATNPNNPNNPLGRADGNSDAMTTTRVDDKKFVKDAALGGLTEVELGKLAAQKGSSDAVKQFGQKLVDDHTKANDELKQIASTENIQVPDTLDSKHQSRVDKLSKLSGPSFDKAYIKDQVKDHEKDVKEFQSEAQGGSDPNVKQFASKTLPVLQQHLSMAKDLSKSTKESSAK